MGHSKKQVKLIGEAWARLNELLAEQAAPKPDLPLEPGLGASKARTARHITFVKYFNGSTPYRYAAVRPEGRDHWSITGRTTMTRMTWDAMMAFVVKDELDPIRAAASVRQLTTPTNNTGLDYAEEEVEEDLLVDAMNYQNTRPFVGHRHTPFPN